jgi:hydrogenase nickel incorporation protein HypB
MTENKEIEIMESVYDKNEEVAARINSSLTGKGIYAINVWVLREQERHQHSYKL